MENVTDPKRLFLRKFVAACKKSNDKYRPIFLQSFGINVWARTFKEMNADISPFILCFPSIKMINFTDSDNLQSLEA